MTRAPGRRPVLQRGCLLVVLLIAGTAAAFLGLVAWQGSHPPNGTPRYVALGSSFAGGIGLGPRVAGSPLVCQRSAAGYPARLARQLRIDLVDRTCSAATLAQVLRGGQFFQGPQVNAIDNRTRLVTITAGGNDVRYVGDMTFLAARNAGGFLGQMLSLFWSGPLAESARDFSGVERDLSATIREARRRAPATRIVVVTYPAILPPQGTCERVALSANQADAMRRVGARLAAATRAAAAQEGTTLIDLANLGQRHDACARAPWVNGWHGARGTAFHPNAAGARAAAQLIARALHADEEAPR